MTSIRRVRLGVIVPSSNTELEPTIHKILTLINASNAAIQITAHFSRLRVTQISLDDKATSQFNLDYMLQAALLLTDAGVDAIAWCGTSAGWLGIETDRRFCKAFTEHSATPITTSTLALLEYMRENTVRKIGLITPYVQEMNHAIRSNFAKERIEVVDDACLFITDNQAIAKVTTQTMETMLNAVMLRNPGLETVAVFYTNMSAVNVLHEWEEKWTARRLTILDSIAVTVWGLLRQVSLDTQRIVIPEDLGRLFTSLGMRHG